MSEAESESLLREAARLRERGSALISEGQALRKRGDAIVARIHMRAARTQKADASANAASDLLLDAIATVLETITSQPRKSDARLALLEQLGDLVTRFQLADLGVAEADARVVWLAFGLDRAPATLPSAES